MSKVFRKRQKGQEVASPCKEGSQKPAGVATVGNLAHKKTGQRFQAGNPMRFRPGQSGNPSGRPSAARAVSVETIKERLGRVDPKFGTTALERIVERMIRLALQ